MATTNEPSDVVLIENLRPKTVPEQLIALGTICQVSDLQIRIQITGGIVCLVDRDDISKPYSNLLRTYQDDYKIGKQPLVEPTKLSELFKKGQQYVCKIIDKQTRKGYTEAQDIIATLDPEQIQENNVPMSILAIPNIPLQGAIMSVEDHGYRVDLGFKTITGFLKFDQVYCCQPNEEDDEDDDEDEAETNSRKAKFFIGQVIRCYSNEVLSSDSESRIVQLTMTQEAAKKAKFSREKCSQHALTQKSILPGSKGYLTVMKVRKDGLVVNFLDEFAGFVSLDHLEEDWQSPEKSYKISDRKKCTVLYYNPITRTFALSLKPEKLAQRTLAHFLNDYHVGRIIKDAQVVFLNGLKSVNFKVGQFKALANVRDALNEDVTTMNKDELHLALDAAYSDGSKYKGRIKSINYADLILVLNMRQDFLQLSCVSIDELEPGDFLEVQVKKHVRDGIVVSFGLNLRAIILNNHLKDYISLKSHKRYPIGMPLKTRVLKVDPDKHPSRVYLTNKEQLLDPEMTIIDAYDTSFRGETVSALVAKLKSNGLIVELFNNVKGFIPIRFCSSSDARIQNMSDLFQLGQLVTCTVYRVEPKRQTMALSIVPYEKVVELIKAKRKGKQERDKLRELSKIDKKIERIEEEEEATLGKTEAAAASRLKKRKKCGGDDENDDEENVRADERKSDKKQKSRLERSKEAKLREEKIREIEAELLDPNRPAQSIGDFERLVLKSPNSADVWIKYSKFFLANVETDKARIVCRRALSTINFRMEQEKLKVWLHLVSIEAKFGGTDKLRDLLEEAAKTNDRMELFRRAARVLISCGELDETERIYEQLLDKFGGKKQPDIWIEMASFLMNQRKNLQKARSLYESAVKVLEAQASDVIYFKSRFARLEFQYGDVERGKTLFESLLSEHPKRMDLWSVYGAAVSKFGTRQLDSEEVRKQNEDILERIATLKEN